MPAIHQHVRGSTLADRCAAPLQGTGMSYLDSKCVYDQLRCAVLVVGICLPSARSLAAAVALADGACCTPSVALVLVSVRVSRRLVCIASTEGMTHHTRSSHPWLVTPGQCTMHAAAVLHPAPLRYGCKVCTRRHVDAPRTHTAGTAARQSHSSVVHGGHLPHQNVAHVHKRQRLRANAAGHQHRGIISNPLAPPCPRPCQF